jgi:replicative DNA helicase
MHEAIVTHGGADVTIFQCVASASGAEMAYALSLVSAFVTFEACADYARAVTEAYHRRKLVQACERAISATKLGTHDAVAHGIGLALVGQVDAILEGTEHFARGPSLGNAAAAAIAHADAASAGELVFGRSTGMATVDAAIDGLAASTFNVLAARPGQGKSALGMQWAISVARQCRDNRERAGVIVIALEMGATAIGRRALAELSRVSIKQLKRGDYQGRRAAVVAAQAELADLPLVIEDAGGQTVAAIRQKCREAARRYGSLALIVVDHLHIVARDEADRRHGDTQAVGAIANQLLATCKEFQAPVLALCQLSRGLLARDDKRPNLGDLRQAGAIEENADTVIFVHRPEEYLSKSEPDRGGLSLQKHQAAIDTWREENDRLRGQAELIVAKLRDGRPCVIKLRFDHDTASFGEPPAPVPGAQGSLGDWDDRYFTDDQGAI